MFQFPNLFRKHKIEHDSDGLIDEEHDEAERPNFLRKNILPIGIGLLCILLVIGYVLKMSFTSPKVIPKSQNFDSCVTLAAVGDISLSAKQLRTFRNASGQYDFSNCFSRVAQTISSADFAVGNLEAVYGTDDTQIDSDVMPAAFLDALSDCGFDMLQTANSQSIKNGISSVSQTIDALEARNMKAVGTFRSAEEKAQTGGIQIFEKNGIRIALLAFTKGLNNMHLPDGNESAVNLLYRDYDSEYSIINEDGIISCINKAKGQSVDFIVAMVHWGSENDTTVSESQKNITELMIDNGVDVILGSHSHVVGQIECRPVLQADGSWKNTYIAYSLGDFLTSSEQSKTQYSCILNLRFEKDSSSGYAAITGISYTPTYCTSPSKSLGTSEYAVIDSLNAIHLLETQYYNAITDALSEKLTDTLDALTEQTMTDYQIVKNYTN